MHRDDMKIFWEHGLTVSENNNFCDWIIVANRTLFFGGRNKVIITLRAEPLLFLFLSGEETKHMYRKKRLWLQGE